MTFIQIHRYYKIWAQNIRAMFNVLFLFVVFFMPVKNYENSEQNRFQLLSDSPFFNRDCC